jgi:hypothetical protein
MDEVLGTPSGLPDSATIWAADLFRYTTNLQRTYTTNGDNAYFSLNGTNLLARYNQSSDGDYGDWWSATAVWAPPGMVPVPQVQDAFADPGIIVNLGTNEVTLLDIIGWTLAPGVPPKAPPLSIAGIGSRRILLYWPANFGGYVLEQTTNLATAAWVSSPTGSENPATITAAGGQTFYRLNKPPAKLNILLVAPPPVPTKNSNSLRRVTHVFHPRESDGLLRTS